MSTDTNDQILDLMEILLTAEVINLHAELGRNDLPPRFRNFFEFSGNDAEIKRPAVISEGIVKREMGIEGAYQHLKSNPFVEHEEFGQRIRITALEPASKWFLKRGVNDRLERNPALAYYYEKSGGSDISYDKVRSNSPLFEDTTEYIEAKLSGILADSEEMRTARDLIIINAPEEVECSLDNLVCNSRQKEMLKKIDVALQNREFLKDHRIYEFGKLLFVGPPGTGKTSLSLAMSHELHMPVLEVRLAMITSQYLGETSKNIDRIFELARHLSPCILFIDEFDFVAKTRVGDDNGAMKRAVNMLLKNIDAVSFVKDGVLLIGATNHPRILDEAVWRRFDEVVEFPLPDQDMREKIIMKATSSLDFDCEYGDLAERTEGFSGSDLRIMIKEAIISALMRGSREVNCDDVEKGMEVVDMRNMVRQVV